MIRGRRGTLFGTDAGTFTDLPSMLSLRVFGEDITKPHTATLRGEAGGVATDAAPAAKSSAAVTVDEEAAQNA